MRINGTTQNRIANDSIRFLLSSRLKWVYNLVVSGDTCPTYSAICCQLHPRATQIEMNEYSGRNGIFSDLSAPSNHQLTAKCEFASPFLTRGYSKGIESLTLYH